MLRSHIPNNSITIHAFAPMLPKKLVGLNLDGRGSSANLSTHRRRWLEVFSVGTDDSVRDGNSIALVEEVGRACGFAFESSEQIVVTILPVARAT